MSLNKILVCPESDYVEDEILYLQTSWDGEIFQLSDPYVTFDSASTFALSVYNATKNWDGKLEYSTDTENWSVWDGISAINAALYDAKYSIFLRGTGNTVLTGNDVEKRWVLTGSGIAIHGDVGWLLNYKNAKDLIPSSMGAYCCAYMFKGCTAIVDPLNLVYGIPAPYCYQNMYYGCTNLISSALMSNSDIPFEACYLMYVGCSSLVNVNPLPAMKVAAEGYNAMFINCSSIVNPPLLPATELGLHCYGQMFSGCSSLISSPYLPARTVPGDGYDLMFSNCIGLESAGIIGATSIGGNGCKGMFKGCTSLTSAPEIQATTLGNNSCKEMFYGCTSLVIAPAIQATTVGENACQDMFNGCTSLTTPPPNLKSVTLNSYCYQGMFYGCSELLSMPIISARTLAHDCCREMFFGCSNLVNVTPLLSENLRSDCYLGMFEGCSSLTAIPSMNISTWGYWSCARMFKDCTGLTAAMDLIGLTYDGTPYDGHPDARGACCKMFYGCTGILEVPRISCETVYEVLFETFRGCTNMDWGENSEFTVLGYDENGKIGTEAFENTFYDCTSLREVVISWPESDSPVIAGKEAFHSMFYGCSSLESTIDLPDNLIMDTQNSASSTMAAMYRNCTSLTEATVGWGIVNRNGCSYMFEGCTSLRVVHGSLGAATAYGCYSYMFLGCTSLVSPPELNPQDGIIEEYSCASMFRDCTSLVIPPALPANTVKNNGYYWMLFGCASLEYLPELPATSIGDSAYYYLFTQCEKIKISETQTGDYINEFRMPSSGTGVDGTDSFKWMFSSTGGTFSATPTINTTYYTSNSIVPANPTPV